MDTTALAEGIREFFTPLFFVLVAVIAIFQLWKLQITRFFQLILLAVLVAVVIYSPGFIVAWAEDLAALLPGDGRTDISRDFDTN
jgi:hypothetical protein